MQEFVFLYPIPEIINFELGCKRWMNVKEPDLFKQKYKLLLNQCIDLRYRQKGFNINYALFNDTTLSDMIELHESDKILNVGMDFKTHTTKKSDGTYSYPNQDYIINQLGIVKVIRIAGFHMWDCVEKLAKRSYERGLNVLVDEDLTEFFTFLINKPNFDVNKFPNYLPDKKDKLSFELFMEVRKERPWLWQGY